MKSLYNFNKVYGATPMGYAIEEFNKLLQTEGYDHFNIVQTDHYIVEVLFKDEHDEFHYKLKYE